jgi:hypothetical protein
VEYLFRRPTFICLHSLFLFFYADQLVIIRLVGVGKGDKFCFYVVLKVYFILKNIKLIFFIIFLIVLKY